MKFYRATCTYDLDVQVNINATWSASDGSTSIDSTAVIDVELYNRSIVTQPAPGSDPTLSGNLAVPVWPDTTESGINAFQSSGPGAGRILMISRDRGLPNAGTASVAWALQPNPLRPRISEVFFRHPTVPEQNWVRVGQNGTVDGNWVQIVALVDSPREVTLLLRARVYDVETGELLPLCQNFQAIVAPNQRSEISCTWHTEGWAWDAPSGGSRLPTAHSNRRFRFELGEPDDLYGTKEQSVVVRPKPVILVHGLNSNAQGWNDYPRMLAAANEYWKGYAVPGMATGDNILNQKYSTTLRQNAKIMHDYIEAVRKLETAEHVDIVAHSLGGLISRTYIHYNMLEDTLDGTGVARHLVMLGTPNQGSDCASIGLLMSLRLGLPNIIAPHQLRPSKVAEFNEEVTNQRKVKFSILAGNDHPFLCNPFEDGPSDTVVTVPSAHYIYLDRGLTKSMHTDMTSSQVDFVSWVLPHLAEGRKKAGVADTAPQMTPAATQSTPLTTMAELQFSQVVSQTVAAGATVDISLSIPQAQAFGVVLITEPDMTTTLLDPAGTVVDSIAATSERARPEWRSFKVNRPVPGRWMLRLQNQGQGKVSAIAAVMLDGSMLRAVGQASSPDAEGRVKLTVAVTNDGGAARGGTARVKVANGSGKVVTVPLFDDGQHDDGAAGDGLFGARTASLAGGMQGALVEVELGGETRIVVLGEGASVQPPPPAARYVVFLPGVQR
jgi:pimeloyl-ACP methyl ester carboxylesterase